MATFAKTIMAGVPITITAAEVAKGAGCPPSDLPSIRWTAADAQAVPGLVGVDPDGANFRAIEGTPTEEGAFPVKVLLPGAPVTYNTYRGTLTVGPAPIEVTPGAPTFNYWVGSVSVPNMEGVVYRVNGDPATGDVVGLSGETIVEAFPESSQYALRGTTSWSYMFPTRTKDPRVGDLVRVHMVDLVPPDQQGDYEWVLAYGKTWDAWKGDLHPDRTMAVGIPTTPGEYEVELQAWTEAGSVARTAMFPLTVHPAGWVAPTPVDPEPEPEEPGDPGTTPDGHHPLSARVAAYVGRADDPETLALADAQVPIVEAFVHGYTRGRGFKDGRPVAPLQAVVVTAAARLVTNPEQVYQYTTADYSERPAVLNGWTIPERGILHNYRKRAGSCG